MRLVARVLAVVVSGVISGGSTRAADTPDEAALALPPNPPPRPAAPPGGGSTGLGAVVTATESVDLGVVTRIRDEAFQRSKVMDTVAYLSDVIGPRVTGSPQMKRANQWTRDQLASWGLANARLDAWGPFGLGWSFEHCAVHLVAPVEAPLIALPRAWTPGTAGPVRGRALRARLDSEADLDSWSGKLAGAILFAADAVDVQGQEKPALTRLGDNQLEELARFPIPGPPEPADKRREEELKRRRFQRRLAAFLAEEKALALVQPSSREAGVVRVGRGGLRGKDDPRGVLELVMAVEHYDRILRLLARGLPVELELDVRATFHDQDSMAYNTFAEIPGSDRSGEVVMLGAHLDSWHGGTGATDNATGVAIVMEAVRILRALELRPRRTIRVALWSGEEQGLLGSKAWVASHLASRPAPADPEERELPERLWQTLPPLTLKPDHAKLSGYFNVDYGTGPIRGVYLDGNAAARPILERWLEPLADLGARTVTLRSTGSTDHVPFGAVGIPVFEFLRDDVEYRSLTHHTNLDVLDHVRREDVVQAAAVVATLVYHAAMREAPMPRRLQPSSGSPE